MPTIHPVRIRKPNRRPGATPPLRHAEMAAWCAASGIPSSFLDRCAQVSGDRPGAELARSVAVLEALGPVTDASVALILGQQPGR